MKKIIFFLLMPVAVFSLFGQTEQDFYIFFPPITGSSITPDDNALVSFWFIQENIARNYGFTDDRDEADFILLGTFSPYEDGFDASGNRRIRNEQSAAVQYSYNTFLNIPGEQVFLFQLLLKNVRNGQNILLQNLFYYSVDDIAVFYPLLAYNVFSILSREPVFGRRVQDNTGVPAEPAPVRQIYDGGTGDNAVDTDEWRNKGLYLRISADFPVTFFRLRSDGLIGGSGIYSGSFDSPTGVSPLDNKTVALPAMTAGFEIQFLDWLSVEPKFQIGLGYLNDVDFMNMALGLEMKFPLKFMSNVMPEPYAAVSFPIPASAESKVFKSSPPVALGGGIQLGMKGGASGVLFVDVSYMYYMDDTRVYNPYAQLYPNPAEICYQRSVLGIGVGYKFGFVNRR